MVTAPVVVVPTVAIVVIPTVAMIPAAAIPAAVMSIAVVAAVSPIPVAVVHRLRRGRDVSRGRRPERQADAQIRVRLCDTACASGEANCNEHVSDDALHCDSPVDAACSPHRFNLRVAAERHCDRMLRSDSM